MNTPEWFDYVPEWAREEWVWDDPEIGPTIQVCAGSSMRFIATIRRTSTADRDEARFRTDYLSKLWETDSWRRLRDCKERIGMTRNQKYTRPEDAPATVGMFESFRQEIKGEFMTVHSKLEKMDGRFEGHESRFDRIERRFDEVDKRFERVDARFDEMEKRFEQVDKRFEQVDLKFAQVDKRFDEMAAEIKVLHAKIDSLAAAVLAELASLRALLENQRSENRFAYDKLAEFQDRVERVEDRVDHLYRKGKEP